LNGYSDSLTAEKNFRNVFQNSSKEKITEVCRFLMDLMIWDQARVPVGPSALLLRVLASGSGSGCRDRFISSEMRMQMGFGSGGLHFDPNFDNSISLNLELGVGVSPVEKVPTTSSV
jgi:hypothetical protein